MGFGVWIKNMFSKLIKSFREFLKVVFSRGTELMLAQLKNNNRGVVFVTVLMVIIVMMVITVSILGLNISQVVMAENRVKAIQAEVLARGALDYFVMTQFSAAASNLISFSETVDNFTFNVTANLDSSGGGYHGTDPLDIQVNY